MNPTVNELATALLHLSRSPTTDIDTLRASMWELPPEGWGLLDRRLRQLSYRTNEAQGGSSEGRTLILCAMSCHRNGYVREKALQELAVRRDAIALPFLILRLSDWVRPIRYIAGTLVEDRLTTAPPSHWVGCLPLLAQVERQSRCAAGSFLARLRQRVLQPDGLESLWQGLGSPHRAVRRLCFDWLSRHVQDPEDCRRLLQRGLEDRDVAIQYEAAQAARFLLRDGALEASVEAMRHSPNTAVRREAAFTLVSRLPEVAARQFPDWLEDASAEVRSRIRKWRGAFDYPGFYRNRLAQGGKPRLMAARLRGLIETAGADSVPDLLDYLDHASPHVRRVAVQGLARFDADADLLFGMMSDPSPTVSEQARQALQARWSELPLDRVVAGLDDPLAVRSLVRLLPAYGRWPGLPYIIGAVGHTDPHVSTLGRTLLQTWVARINRQFTRPSVAEAEAVRGALQRHSGALQSEVHTAILRALMVYTL